MVVGGATACTGASSCGSRRCSPAFRALICLLRPAVVARGGVLRSVCSASDGLASWCPGLPWWRGGLLMASLVSWRRFRQKGVCAQCRVAGSWVDAGRMRHGCACSTCSVSSPAADGSCGLLQEWGCSLSRVWWRSGRLGFLSGVEEDASRWCSRSAVKDPGSSWRCRCCSESLSSLFFGVRLFFPL